MNLDDLVSTQAVNQVYHTSDLNQLQSTFYLLIFGNTLALILLFFEISAKFCYYKTHLYF